MTKDEVLIEYMNEHYAHARDHEALRGQIASILCAAAFVLIGLAVDKEAPGRVLVAVGIVTIILGLINLVINLLHVNRFKAHVAVANAILKDLETRLWAGLGNEIKPSEARTEFEKKKSPAYRSHGI